jgi:hypothetical protein
LRRAEQFRCARCVTALAECAGQQLDDLDAELDVTETDNVSRLAAQRRIGLIRPAGPQHRGRQVGLDHRAAPGVPEPLVDRERPLEQFDGVLAVVCPDLERAEVGLCSRLPCLVADLSRDVKCSPAA